MLAAIFWISRSTRLAHTASYLVENALLSLQSIMSKFKRGQPAGDSEVGMGYNVGVARQTLTFEPSRGHRSWSSA